jgi:hypothetical protein
MLHFLMRFLYPDAKQFEIDQGNIRTYALLIAPAMFIPTAVVLGLLWVLG